MQKVIIIALLTLITTVANAEVSGNVALSTDYMYRGQSQTGNTPSISGGIDYGVGDNIYVGAWSSNVDFGNNVTQEIDLYGGYTGKLAGGVSYDVGALYYLYPGAADETNFDFWEGSVGLDYSLSDRIDTSVKASFSPEWQNKSGKGYNLEGTGSYKLNDSISVWGTAGRQLVEKEATWGSPDWNYYSVGATYMLGHLAISASWVDTDLKVSECFSGTNVCEGRAMLTVGTSF